MEPIRLTLGPGGTTYMDLPHEGEEFGYIPVSYTHLDVYKRQTLR